MTRLVLSLALIIAASIVAGLAGRKDPPQVAEAATVERIIDGDTLVIAGGERVRLIGYDAPEKNECYGPEATQRLGELLPVGTTTSLVYQADKNDKYGRTLADITTHSGELVSVAMVASGHGRTMLIRPNGTHANEIEMAQTAAQTHHLGLWAAC